MDLAPVVALLKQTPGVRSCGGAAALDAAEGGRITTPALFVVPNSERVVDEGLDDEGLLRVVFTVVFVVANQADQSGGAAQQDLEVLRQAVHGLIRSLVLPRAQTPPQFSSGSVVLFSEGRLWWADEFVALLIQES